MNPNSDEAIAARATIYREKVTARDRLAREANGQQCDALAQAEIGVRATLSRMAAMGDPIPNLAGRERPSPSSVPLALDPSPPVLTSPAAAGPLPQPEPEPDPIEAAVRRILEA